MAAQHSGYCAVEPRGVASARDRVPHRAGRRGAGDARDPRRRRVRGEGRAAARGGGRARGRSWPSCPRRSCRCTPRTRGRAAPPGSRAGTSCGSACGRTRSTSRARSWRSSRRACARLGVFCAIGVNEREAERPGSLYNTLLLIGPEGLLHKHRKLMPTQHERLFHGIGEGRDLGVVGDRAGAHRRADLLGEPDAAGALRRLPRRPADLGRADRRRLRRAGSPRCATSRSSPARSSSRCRSSSRARRSPTTSRCRSTASAATGAAARRSSSRSRGA